ncbi:hypothetical protein LMG33818_001488 [Halomonadaceae bacterium LMG 33818]|uniref:hypothetical protein n=1 Tax=Cernens ardua TaxID=3402176 RepID=UPI003EDC2C4E
MINILLNLLGRFPFVIKLFRIIGRFFIKKFMLPTYKKSHEVWEGRRSLGRYWYNLGEHIEYSIRHVSIADPENMEPRIALRSKNRKVRALDFVVESFGSGIRYQDRISVNNIDNSPIVQKLINMPRDGLIESSKNGIYFSLDSFKIKHCSLTFDDHVVNIEDSLKKTIMHNWVNDEFIQRIDQLWNTNEIRWVKQDIVSYWKWWFGRPRVFTISSAPVNKSKTSFVKDFITDSIRWFMCLKWLVSLQFWLGIWFGKIVWDEDGHLKIKLHDSSQLEYE